jgi:cytochrome c biogenesis factor
LFRKDANDSTPNFALLAAAFAGTIVAYVPTARQRNWPVGQIFERGTVPIAVYLGVAAFLLGTVVSWAWSGKASWWLLLWTVLASFIGAPLIPTLFKSWSAALSLVAAPVLAVIAIMLPFPL